MKLTAILLTIVLLNVNATGVSQTVTYSGDNILLEKVFSVIKQQTGYLFLYPADVVKDATKVSIHVKDAPLQQALDQALKGQPLRYMIQNKTIVISKNREAGDKKPVDKVLVAPPVDVRGKVLNHKGEPLAGANVRVKGTAIGGITNADGIFDLKGVGEHAVLEISYLGFETKTLSVDGRTNISVQLTLEVSEMASVSVSVYTGYQQIPKERAAGSYVQIENKLLNRGTSYDILGRLEGVASGVAFNRNSKSDQPNISVRGRSTIFAEVKPLIVLDNFPYDGDISNINPNTIESITILRDASAASIYGVRSANGVIVITSKKGSTNKAPQLHFNTNVMVAQKTDMHYFPFMSATDFISLETDFFQRGWYTAQENAITKTPLTPVVELLIKKRSGQISAAEADQQIEALKQNDVLTQYEDHFLRNQVLMQNALSLSGGGEKSKYYLTIGYDKDKSSFVGNSFDRYSINAVNSFKPFNNVEINTGLMYTNTKTVSNNPGINDFIYSFGKKYYPYAQLVDENGAALPVNFMFREPYKASTEAQGFLDWQYRPYDELNLANNEAKQNYNRVNLEIKKIFSPSFDIEVKYQYEKQIRKQNNLMTLATYFTRNLINTYYSPNATVKSPIPMGDILDQTNYELEGHTGRAQANFNQIWHNKHRVSAIGGFEIKQRESQSNQNRLYGYNDETIVSQPVDLVTRFPTNPVTTTLLPIPSPRLITGITERFLSYYANGSYTLNDRYVFSASGRLDNTNYFGIKPNQRIVPLWSVGTKWNMSRENFMKDNNVFDQLALRATYGFNGNVNTDLTAYTTVRYANDGITRAVSATVVNPPNPELRWETINMLNLGVQFTLKENVLSGTIEYFSKKGDHLIGDVAMDPTTGITSFRGNVSNIKGQGVDVQLNSRVAINKQFEWAPTFLFSYATDKVLNYTKTFSAGALITGGSGDASSLSPVIGRPVLSIYSYKWGGLDPATGDPLGYVGEQKTNDYSAILSKTTIADIVYNGPVNPPVVGAFRNDFYWNKLAVSVNITYKLGHYFRRPSVDYGQFLNSWSSNKDYANRWQKPGDEERTNVPSIPATAPGVQSNRDYRFYANSEVLVEKADHIRLQDIVISYDLDKTKLARLPFQMAHIYCNLNNIAILWRANKYGIDPDAVPAYTETTKVLPQPRSITLGAKFDF